MAPRREILDSEDEGDDFESINGETSDALPLEADLSGHHNNSNLDAPAGETTRHSTGSTDPAFFQRIYEEQQADTSITTHPLRVEAPPSSGVITSPGREIQKQPVSTAKSSLTSITDPVPASRRPRKSKQSSMKEVLDLTQITTPRKGGASGEVDPWELPSSPLPVVDNVGSTARSNSRISRSSEKRKRTGQQSSPRGIPNAESSELSPSRDIPDPYNFPDPDDMSPVRPSKRKKRETKSSSARKSRGSDIHQLEEPGLSSTGYEGGHGTTNNGPDSSIPPTLPTMYIAPTSLTDSQKQQYTAVSVSSEHWQEPQEPSAPVGGLETNAYKSSGATTVAYSTPSRFRSSIQRGITDDMLPYPVPAMDPATTAAQDQMSSPDELAGSTRSKRSRAHTSREAQPSSQLESPVLTRSAKHRTRHTNFEDQSNPQGHIDDPIILDNTQKTDDFAHEEVAEMVDSDTQLQQPVSLDEAGTDRGPEMEPQQNYEDDVVENTIPSVQEAPPKKKRGRKKKEQIVEEPILEEEAFDDHAQPAEEIPTPAVDLVTAETEEPPLKKRRGRPRKSESAKLAVPTQTEPHTEGVDNDYNIESESLIEKPKGAKGKANKKAAKKSKKQSRDDDLELEQTDQSPAEPEAEPARSHTEISHNPRQSESLSADGEAETKEKKQQKQPTEPAMKTAGKEESAAPPTKGASTPMTPGKVQYRVGLSKRSRIAPLLKSLRK